MFEIKEAKREASPVFAGFIAQSGGGKTLSMLLFARGLVGPTGKIGLIDTEGGRALIYADDPEVGGFYHLDFVAPWSSDRYREALREMIAAGMDAVIFDSASHEHEAEGGMLWMADQYQGSNRRGKWIKPKMAHGRFITACRSAPVHVLFGIREKVIIDVDKTPAEKIFLPVCDRDLPFEFMLTVRLEPETHRATFIKVPKPFQKHVTDGAILTVEHGRLLMAEAGKGEKIDTVAREAIASLERDAAGGSEALRRAWAATWRQHAPAGAPEDNKAMTPVRRELQKHLERIKGIAAQADADAKARAANPDQFPGDPPADPSEIGTIAPIVPPDFDNLQEGEGELFKPEDKSDF